MAHSFYAAQPGRMTEDIQSKNEFFHAASGTYYRMEERGGDYFQVRWQLGFDGEKTNIQETRIDYVMGSGAHARTYLHRAARGSLTELPLGWYAENGGHWGMSPGYDNPRHPADTRAIGYDCMFCHNAYPETPSTDPKALANQPGGAPVYSGAMPEGIDCTRCHGPGQRHVSLARTAGAKPDAIRGAIVNPARLAGDRQMEVCMQCHLHPTSFPLPNAIKRFDRTYFSYRAGEPLSAFLLYFDQAAPEGKHADRFEIGSSVYRLRQSACFRKGNGALGCVTCHDPHAPHGEPAKGYDATCRSCHRAPFDALVQAGKHTASGNCAACHMPKRRTEDVVHVLMTDHLIQRRPAGDLIAERPERTEADRYRGPVVPYYPRVPTAKDAPLYLSLAQVKDQSNLAKGIPQLASWLEANRPALPAPWFEFGEALRNAKRFGQGASAYREASRRDARYLPALLALGSVMKDSGKPREAAEVWKQAIQVAPEDPRAWNEIGQLGNSDALRKAVQLDPQSPLPHNALGILAAQQGDFTTAEGEFREAIRILPSAGDAHGNLANLLAARQDGPQSLYEFGIALQLLPRQTTVRYRYAAVLNAMGHFEEARGQLETLRAQDPNIAEARDLLGNLYERAGDTERALAEYQAAVQLEPRLSRAQLVLGATLSKKGDDAGAARQWIDGGSRSRPARRGDQQCYGHGNRTEQERYGRDQDRRRRGLHVCRPAAWQLQPDGRNSGFQKTGEKSNSGRCQ